MVDGRHIALLAPDRLWSRSEVLVRDCPVPREPGVYAWYFRETPPGVPTAECHRAHGLPLLYVGISPKRPPTNGAPASRQSLRTRIRCHFRGNAAGSTLRLTLGCLLEPVIGTRLRRVGSGGRFTFADREDALSAWMERNALVTWVPIEEPWEHEHALIQSLRLPLNLDQNSQHPFHPVVSQLRRTARERARELPVWRKAELPGAPE